MVDFEVSIIRERPKADGTSVVKFQWRDKESTPPATEVPFKWPAGKPVHLRIERNDDENKPLGRVYLDSQLIASDIPFPRSTANYFLLGVSASGQTGRTCSLSFDNVRVVRKTAQ